MRELASSVRRLRQVKEAYRSFLLLGAMEQMAADPSVMARVADDVHRQPPSHGNPDDAALADPYNHDWSLLYRGSVLDD